MKKCPYCAEKIQDDAVVCRYCGRDLPAPLAPMESSGSASLRTRPPLASTILLAFSSILAAGFVIFSWTFIARSLAFDQLLLRISASGERYYDAKAGATVEPMDGKVCIYHFPNLLAADITMDGCMSMDDIKGQRTAGLLTGVFSFLLIAVLPIIGWRQLGKGNPAAARAAAVGSLAVSSVTACLFFLLVWLFIILKMP